MNFKERAKELFKTHPGVDEFHFTSDGYGFFSPAQAESHGRTLGKSMEETKVVPITREEVGDLEDEKGPDYSKMKKAELMDIAAVRGLDISEAKTVAQIIEVLKKSDEATEEHTEEE